MSTRFVAVLVLLLAVLGGGALLIRHQGSAQKPPASGTLGQPLLKGLKAAEVASIVIREPKATLTLARKGEQWTVVERAGYAADFDKVRDFVLKALELKIGQTEPIGEKDRARLLLDASGTTVEFLGADGKPLASFIVGKKYFKTEPERPLTARGDGRFVLLPGDEKNVVIVSDPLAQASTKSADWIARAGFAAEGVKVLDYRPASGEGWKIERSGDNADWKLSPIKGSEKLEVIKANSASYSLNNVEFADVAAKDLKPGDTGLDKPITLVATTIDGLTYTIRLGKLAGENYYAQVAVAGEPKPQGKDAEDRLKRINERLPREKALAEHVVLIAKSKFDDILKPRAELLEKKDPKK
ncbi:MAG: DUF4340 domain-containing protein [Betaproteobacteria bacterium]|nr:DUF4340 domain-containing protein [Betaproteobacteria bacterium]